MRCAQNDTAAMIAETAPGTGKTGTLVLNKTATKNGYVYIYLSNESTNTPVYFDDMQVSHKRGPIVEDNAFYPFGLKIQGISARAALKPKTKEGYQGVFNEFDEESGYNEFELRSYDAQVGRFVSADPYDQFASPYVGMGNDPINNIDENGGWSAGLTGMVIGAVGGAAAGYFIAKNKGASTGGAIAAGFGGALLGAGIGYGITESLANTKTGSFNGSDNIWRNFRGFYDGLFTGGNHIIGNNKYGAWSPEILKIPKINITIKFKYLLPKWKYNEDVLFLFPPGFGTGQLVFLIYNFLLREIIRYPRITIR